MCIKNKYSARELDRQISSGYFHRYMLSDGKANDYKLLLIKSRLHHCVNSNYFRI